MINIVLLTGVPNAGKTVAANLLKTREFKLVHFSPGRERLPVSPKYRAEVRVSDVYAQHEYHGHNNFVFDDTTHQVEIDVITGNFDSVQVINIRPRYVGYESMVMIGEPDRPDLKYGHEVLNLGNTSTLMRQLDKIIT